MNKKFFVFFWSFCAVITCAVVLSAVLSKEYGRLAPFAVVLAFVTALSVYLYMALALPATDFILSDNEINFLFKEKTETASLTDLRSITETPARYIFIFKDRKYAVSRLKGKLCTQEKTDPRISELSKRCNIPTDVRITP